LFQIDNSFVLLAIRISIGAPAQLFAQKLCKAVENVEE